MKKYIRTLSLLLTTVLTISLTGCGSGDADGGKDRKGLMAAKELSGVWTDESGNILRLDTVESTYTYRTRYGRIGSGSPPQRTVKTRRSLNLAIFCIILKRQTAASHSVRRAAAAVKVLTARASPRAEKYRTSRSKSLAECGRTAKGKHL